MKKNEGQREESFQEKGGKATLLIKIFPGNFGVALSICQSRRFLIPYLNLIALNYQV